jgi:hypothetical protein
MCKKGRRHCTYFSVEQWIRLNSSLETDGLEVVANTRLIFKNCLFNCSFVPRSQLRCIDLKLFKRLSVHIVFSKKCIKEQKVFLNFRIFINAFEMIFEV